MWSLLGRRFWESSLTCCIRQDKTASSFMFGFQQVHVLTFSGGSVFCRPDRVGPSFPYLHEASHQMRLAHGVVVLWLWGWVGLISHRFTVGSHRHFSEGAGSTVVLAAVLCGGTNGRGNMYASTQIMCLWWQSWRAGCIAKPPYCPTCLDILVLLYFHFSAEHVLHSYPMAEFGASILHAGSEL